MNKNKILRVFGIFALVIVTAMATRIFTMTQVFGSDKDFSKFLVIEDYLRKNYLYSKDIKDEDLETGQLKGLVAGLKDPYSQYLTKEEMNKLSEQTTGKFQGIGVIISPHEDGTVTVVSPIKGSPAEKAGIESGDKILKINGVDFTSDKIDEASKAIRGETGSEVELLILKNDSKTTKELKVKRQEIKMDSIIKGKIGDVGYIGIIMFDTDTGADFKKALNELTKEGVKSLVLDLRGNPGGVVEAAVEIGDAILPKSNFCTLKDNKNEIVESYKTDEKYNNIKMAVLVNEGSASASEILAGAIKDLNRAKIIGQKTFGKGVVQNVVKFPKGDGLKLTTSEYFTPSGDSINKVGIEPDIKVELNKAAKGIGIEHQKEDNQLQKALEILKK